MEEALVSPAVLALLFLVVAFAYASVGLGGGSSYTALLTIFGVSHAVIPTVSLLMNLVVTAMGGMNFARRGHVRLPLILPFLLTSMPMAWLGGSLRLQREIFYWILLVSLLVIAFRIYVWKDLSLGLRLGAGARIAVSLLSGSILGLVAGIVGIGGGIYLVPLIILLGLGSEKEAAACGSIFIFVNSAAGLAARIYHYPVEFMPLLPLVAAVLVGGLLGSHLGSSRLEPRTMQRVLGGIVLLAILFLARQLML